MFLDEKQQGEAQTAEQANRKLKLSEAMRIGAKLREQGFGCPKLGGQQDRARFSCALQAAVEGATGLLVNDPGTQAKRIFGLPGHLAGKVWRKNDHEKLSREAIADWLEAQGL